MTTELILISSFLLITGTALLIFNRATNNGRQLIRIPVRIDEDENVRHIEVK